MTARSLSQWLDYISSTHPSEIEMGLDRVKSVFLKLPANHSQAKIVLVAGTNGKGSTIAMLEASLLVLGYKVGAYTSPHILAYNERIRVNAIDVIDSELISAFEAVELARETTALTYFEYGTLAALDILLAKDLDVILLEIGLGGRLDAVNIVDPDLCIITSVALDHTDWLGDTVEQIGSEKAGILRQKSLFIGGEQLPDSVHEKSKGLLCQSLICRNDFNVLRDDDQETVQLVHAGQRIICRGFPDTRLPENNMLISLQATVCLFSLMNPGEVFTQSAYRQIKKTIEPVSIPGRLEHVLQTDQHDVFLDVGHNPHAAVYLKDFLTQYADSGAAVQIVYSALLDKDVLGVLKHLSPVVNRCVLMQLDCDRAMPLQELAILALESGLECIESFSDVNEAFRYALSYPQTFSQSQVRVVTLILGSFFMVEAAKRFLEAYD